MYIQLTENPCIRDVHCKLFHVIEMHGGSGYSACKLTDRQLGILANIPEDKIIGYIEKLRKFGYIDTGYNDEEAERHLYIEYSFHERYKKIAQIYHSIQYDRKMKKILMDIRRMDEKLFIAYANSSTFLGEKLPIKKSKHQKLIDKATKAEIAESLVPKKKEKPGNYVDIESETYLKMLSEEFRNNPEFVTAYKEFKQHRFELIPSRGYTSGSEKRSLNVIKDRPVAEAIEVIYFCIKKAYQALYDVPINKTITEINGAHSKKSIFFETVSKILSIDKELDVKSRNRITGFSVMFGGCMAKADEAWEKFHGDDDLGWMDHQGIIIKFVEFQQQISDELYVGHFDPKAASFQKFAKWYDREYMNNIKYLVEGFCK